MIQLLRSASALRDLAIFEAVARNGGFRAAALELGADHLTVARHVRALEAALGARLFVLDRRRLRLTSKGESLLRAVMPGLDSLTTAIARHTEKGGGKPLRIACEPGFLGCWLLPRIRQLRERIPDLDLTLQPASTALGQVDVDADIAIQFTDEAGPDDIVLCRPAAIAVCSREVLARHQGFPTLASLLEANLIHDDSENYWPWWFRKCGLSAKSIGKGQFLQVMDARLAIEAARSGLGVALLNTLIAGDDLRSGRLSRARPEEAAGECYVVHTMNTSRRKHARKFAAWSRAAMQSEGFF